MMDPILTEYIERADARSQPFEAALRIAHQAAKLEVEVAELRKELGLPALQEPRSVKEWLDFGFYPIGADNA